MARVSAFLLAAIGVAACWQPAAGGEARGTIDDPIIDSRMTEKEAFDGLDPKCPALVRARQKVVAVLYCGFDGKIHRGQLVVHEELARDIREVFDLILKLKFPIKSVVPVADGRFRKDGRWSDDLSMAANNTSAFNYRLIDGSASLSNHAFGRAIDINPVQNPYVQRGVVRPAGASYDVKAAGTLTSDHPIVQAFLRRGWRWGGNWRSLKDYQHFEKPARSKGAGPARTPKVPPTWLKPRALRRGDTIAFVAPASAAAKEPVLQYAKQLEADGFRVLLPKTLGRSHGYVAGSDEERAAELNAAIRNPSVAAIFCCRGGFGVTRILDRIDYAALRRQPKIVTGFSDITALHLAIARKARLITFHSPMPEHNLWRQDGDFAFPAASFRRMLFAQSYKDDGQLSTVALRGDLPRPVKLVGGKARGRLVGGNLTLICATLGTPYAIEPKGNVLMIEDTKERPYQIDRALSQLRLAGVLDAVAGVVIGQFDKTDDAEVARIMRDYFGRRKIPVVGDFPVGHRPYNVTLPHGALVELDAGAGSLRLLEAPLTVD